MTSWPPAQTPASQVIDDLGMKPLAEEGGYWTAGPRRESLNGIRFLLTDDDVGFSALHQLAVDEGWTWLAGAPARHFCLEPGSAGRWRTLDPSNPQVLVPATCWQGARTTGAWTLVTCWCAPAFTDDGFVLGARDQLLDAHPDEFAAITALTRTSS